MKTLETEMNYAGHTLRQIWREKDVAVYTRSLTPDSEPHELELIFIKSIPDKIMPNGEMTPAHEAFPSPSQWGREGFSFPIRCLAPVLVLAGECSSIVKDRAALVKERRRITQWP
jgi:hypothetical protein